MPLSIRVEDWRRYCLLGFLPNPTVFLYHKQDSLNAHNKNVRTIVLPQSSQSSKWFILLLQVTLLKLQTKMNMIFSKVMLFTDNSISQISHSLHSGKTSIYGRFSPCVCHWILSVFLIYLSFWFILQRNGINPNNSFKQIRYIPVAIFVPNLMFAHNFSQEHCYTIELHPFHEAFFFLCAKINPFLTDKQVGSSLLYFTFDNVRIKLIIVHYICFQPEAKINTYAFIYSLATVRESLSIWTCSKNY